MPLEVGTLLLGYTIGRRIGGGSFGEVFEATASGQRVAVKFIPRDKIVQRWLDREVAAIVAASQHPHDGLVRVLAKGEVTSPAGYAVVMPLAAGSLLDELKQDRRPTPEQLAGWVGELAGGLDHLHALGFTHGDVTPANALLFGRTAVLTDFGFAREGVNAATSITVRNSTHYAPPEFQDDKTYGPQSDQFSLAATYLHLRIGNLPLDRPFGRPKLADLPADERRVLETAFAPRPDDRYPSCGAFARALADALPPPLPLANFSLPDVAERLSLVERSLAALTPPTPRGNWKDQSENPSLWRATWREAWGKVKPWLPVGVAAALAVLIGLVFASAVPTSPPPPPPTGFARDEEVAALRKQLDAVRSDELTSLRGQVDALRGGADYPKLFARALAAYREKKFTTAKVLLDVCPEGERQFEYHLLARAVAAGGGTGPGGWPEDTFSELASDSKMPIRSVAFSPNPNRPRVGWGRSDGNVEVWDQEWGRKKVIFRHASTVNALTFHPNGEFIASAGDEKVWVHEVNGNVSPTEFTAKINPLTSVGFDDSGRLMYAGRNHEVYLRGNPAVMAVCGGAVADDKVWAESERNFARNTALNKQPDLNKHYKTVPCPAVLRGDGRVLAAVGFDGVLCLTATEVFAEGVSDYGTPSALPVGISVLAFSPDGKRIGLVTPFLVTPDPDKGRANGVVTLLRQNHQAGIKLAMPTVSDTRCLAFDPSGTRVVTGDADGTVRVWHADTGAELLAVKSHDGEVYSVAVSPVGKQIASGGKSGTLMVWGIK